MESFFIWLRLPSSATIGGLAVALIEVLQRMALADLRAGLIIAVERVDVLDELAVEQMQRNALRDIRGCIRRSRCSVRPHGRRG